MDSLHNYVVEVSVHHFFRYGAPIPIPGVAFGYISYTERIGPLLDDVISRSMKV